MQDFREFGTNTSDFRGTQADFGFSPDTYVPAGEHFTRSTAQVVDLFEHYLAVKLGTGIRLPSGSRLQVTAATIGLDFDQHRGQPTVDVVSARLPANATIRLILQLARHSARHQLEEALRCLREPEGRHRRTNAARALASFVREMSLHTVSSDAASTTNI
jgi:hypothetical protein